MPSAAENVKEIYTNTMCFENGDLFGRTNFHEFNEEDGCMSCSVVPLL